MNAFSQLHFLFPYATQSITRLFTKITCEVVNASLTIFFIKRVSTYEKPKYQLVFSVGENWNSNLLFNYKKTLTIELIETHLSLFLA